MRKTFVLIAAALMAFGAVSCKKEIENNDLSNRPVRFSATMENSGDSKTTLNGYALLWADGDQVKVMCDEFTTAGVYQVVSGGKRHADFVFAGEESSEETLVAPFKAGYPADYWNDNVTSITLPATQNYVANGMEKFPMYGEVAEGMGVDFKNLCGVIRLRLVKPGESVTKIAITTTNYLNGEFSVSMVDGLPVMQHVTGGTNGDTLYCADPVSINSTTDFYIYLPAGTYNPMRIEVFNNRGLLCSMDATAAITIERNKITTIAPPAESLKFQTCTGLITVALENGVRRQVRFAQGNLIYDNGTWKIAEHEYDVYKQSGVDIFHWSTVNNNYGLGEADYTGAFNDWGFTIGQNFRTLTSAEWSVILASGQGSANGYNRNENYTRGKIIVGDDTYYGYIILPDLKYSNNIPNCPSHVKNYTTNVYTYEQWQVLQAHGVAFLPVAKNGTTQTPMWQYWTATEDASNTNRALTQNVGATANASGYYGKEQYKPVRLVQPYEPLTITVE